MQERLQGKYIIHSNLLLSGITTLFRRGAIITDTNKNFLYLKKAAHGNPVHNSYLKFLATNSRCASGEMIFFDKINQQ